MSTAMPKKLGDEIHRIMAIYDTSRPCEGHAGDQLVHEAIREQCKQEIMMAVARYLESTREPF